MKINNLRTIDEYVNKPAGSFKKFVSNQQRNERKEEQQRRDRIRRFKRDQEF